MKYLAIAMTAAAILLASQAYAGTTRCTTYGNVTNCTYTPSCTWINGRQVCG